MWIKQVKVSGTYDAIVSVLQSMDIPFEEHIIDSVVAYDIYDTPTYNLRKLEYKDPRGVFVCYTETMMRYLDETKDDCIEAFYVKNPSEENSKGGWVTEWVIPKGPDEAKEGKMIPRKKVMLPTNDYIFNKCLMEEYAGGTSFYSFKAKEFPEYASKLYFMPQPTGYQDGDVESHICIEARSHQIEDAWIQENKEFIKNSLDNLLKDQKIFNDFFKVIFDYAINKLNLYTFYAFGTKIIENEKKERKTVFVIRGCEKVVIEKE